MYGSYGCKPVADTCSTCNSPWSNSDTLVGAADAPPVAPRGASVRCATSPAPASGCSPCVPLSSVTAPGTYTIACGPCPIGTSAITLFVVVSMAIKLSPFSSPTYMRLPSPDGQTPYGNFPTGIVATWGPAGGRGAGAAGS